MRLLVIGGTEFFGKRIVEQSLARGDEVTVFTRGRRRPAFWDAIEHIRGDRTDHAAFVQALRGRSFDVVVDNVAFERPDAEAVVEALGGRIGHCILTSSGSVYPDFEPPEAFRAIPEDAADLSLRGDLAYAEGKRACEQALHDQQAFPFTIIRPPIVQGPNDPSRRGWFWIQRVADGGPVLVPQKNPSCVWRQAYSGDIAATVLLAAGNPAAFGKTYNVASEEITSLDDFVRLVAEILDKPDPVVPVPHTVLSREAPWYRPTFAHRFVMDITRITQDLGFSPTLLVQWLTETVRWHLEANLEPSRGYGGRDQEIVLAQRLAR